MQSVPTERSLITVRAIVLVVTRDGVPLRVTALTALPVRTATMAAPTVLNAEEEHSQMSQSLLGALAVLEVTIPIKRE